MQNHARVLVTCPSFEPGFRGGGPVRSVSQIVDTAPPGVDLVLVTRDRDLGGKEPYVGLSGKWIARGTSAVYYLDTRKPTHWLRLVRHLRKEPLSLMYVNSLWEPSFTVFPIIMVLLRVLPVHRVLIAPRGELSRGALEVKSRKKQLFLLVWRPLLRHASPMWHASTELEAADIKSAFKFSSSSTFISSDQISEGAHLAPRAHRSRSRFVYIGRITPIKNVLAILDALAMVTIPASLDIYGPIEDQRYWIRCQRVIQNLPEHIKVKYCGELQPHRVLATFVQYDAFVLPTLGENFGHAIAESLAASCPVICSTNTPWTETLENGGGQVVLDLSPSALSVVLERWASLSPAAIAEAHAAASGAFELWRRKQDGTNILAIVLQYLDLEANHKETNPDAES